MTNIDERWRLLYQERVSIDAKKARSLSDVHAMEETTKDATVDAVRIDFFPERKVLHEWLAGRPDLHLLFLQVLSVSPQQQQKLITSPADVVISTGMGLPPLQSLQHLLFFGVPLGLLDTHFFPNLRCLRLEATTTASLQLASDTLVELVLLNVSIGDLSFGDLPHLAGLYLHRVSSPSFSALDLQCPELAVLYVSHTASLTEANLVVPSLAKLAVKHCPALTTATLSLGRVSGDFGVCDHCGVKETAAVPRFQRCSQCSRALYCNETCQTGDWRKHKKQCRERCVDVCTDNQAFLTTVDRYVRQPVSFHHITATTADWPTLTSEPEDATEESRDIEVM